MMQPCENGKNSNFRPSLGPPRLFPWVLALLVDRQCSKLSSYAMFRETNEPNLKKRKKTNFGPDFGPFGPPNFFCRSYLNLLLDVVPTYHPMQFEGKTKNQTWENKRKKLILDPILTSLTQIWAQKNFLVVFPLLVVSHCSNISSHAI